MLQRDLVLPADADRRLRPSTQHSCHQASRKVTELLHALPPKPQVVPSLSHRTPEPHFQDFFDQGVAYCTIDLWCSWPLPECVSTLTTAWQNFVQGWTSTRSFNTSCLRSRTVDAEKRYQTPHFPRSPYPANFQQARTETHQLLRH